MQKGKHLHEPSEEAKRISEPELDMTQILGLLDRESQITNINMLRALKENLDNIQC